MTGDLSSEDFGRLTRAVAAKLVTLTDLPLERAEELAGSVVGCVHAGDEDGMLDFRDEAGAPVVRLPFSAFAALLDDEEDEDTID